MAARLVVVVLVAWLCGVTSTSAAVAIVQSGVGTDAASAGYCEVTLTSVASGNAIVAGGSVEGTETVTYSDDRSNTYATQTTRLHAGNNVRATISYAANVAAGTTVVRLTPSAAQFQACYAAEVSGLATSALLDVSNTAEGASTTVTGAALSSTVTGAAFAIYGSLGNATIAADAPWTALQEQESGAYSVGAFEWQATTPSNTYTPDWTSDSAQNFVIVAVNLREPSAAVGGGGLLLRGAGR
jgi:hypothetical protein